MNNINYFFLNGQKYATSYKLNLQELISYFDYNDSLLVVEYNELICNKTNWKNILIQKNDKIEIVTIVGGG